MSRYTVAIESPNYGHQTDAVDFAAYTRDAIKTESLPKCPNGFGTNFDLLTGCMEIAVAAGRLIDVVKKLVIYGKPIDPAAFDAALMAMHEAMRKADSASCYERHRPQLDRVHVNPRLLHATLGKFGECGEIMEAMLAAINGGALDLVNLGEEFGDDKWYDAVGLDELEKLTGIGLAGWLERNIDKLRIRYPAKFTLAASENRDVAAERVALEGK